MGDLGRIENKTQYYMVVSRYYYNRTDAEIAKMFGMRRASISKRLIGASKAGAELPEDEDILPGISEICIYAACVRKRRRTCGWCLTIAVALAVAAIFTFVGAVREGEVVTFGKMGGYNLLHTKVITADHDDTLLSNGTGA